jgi:2-hydroxy-3-oxopropionate reductase
MLRTIGFIGLGIMGKPMAQNLMKAGYPLVVYNRTASKAQELVSGGAKQVGAPREVADQAEVIITMVADSPEVEQVILDRRGRGSGESRKRGHRYEPISPVVTKKIAAELEKRGSHAGCTGQRWRDCATQELSSGSEEMRQS